MPKGELKRIDIQDVRDLEALAEEVRLTKEPQVLQRGNEDIAMVTPVAPPKARRVPRGKPFTMHDPLWSVMGIGRSEGPTDVSANKHKYIADVIYAESHPSPEA